MGAEKIATGHYAKVQEIDGSFYLLKGDDGSKDQSYFLCMVNQLSINNAIFPIGHLKKSIVRDIALFSNFMNAVIDKSAFNSIIKSSFFIPGTARSISKESLFSIELTDGKELPLLNRFIPKSSLRNSFINDGKTFLLLYFTILIILFLVKHFEL